MKAKRLLLACCLAVGMAPHAVAVDLGAPFGLQWGQSPTEVDLELQKGKFVAAADQSGKLEHFLDERRYSGEVLGLPADHVAPLFYASQLFGVAVSFSPASAMPATKLWEQTVERLTAKYGKPTEKSKPMPLMSWNAVLRLLPPEADKTALLALYSKAEQDPALVRAMLSDLQIQVGLWVPDASWRFGNGAVVKAVMRSGGKGEYGLTALKPTVLYTRYEQLK